jgi:hypothetical protein
MEIETEKRKYIGIKNRGMGWDELLVVFLVFQTPPERMQSYFFVFQTPQERKYMLGIGSPSSIIQNSYFSVSKRHQREKSTRDSQVSNIPVLYNPCLCPTGQCNSNFFFSPSFGRG